MWPWTSDIDYTIETYFQYFQPIWCNSMCICAVVHGTSSRPSDSSVSEFLGLSLGLYRFSIDFSSLRIAYGFLSRSPRFLLAITNIWQNFWLAVEIFKIHWQVWIFMRIFVCLNLFHNTIFLMDI
jgi:hypothetical protein